jgi:hypothetical protein
VNPNVHPKVAAAGVAGAVTTIIVTVAAQLGYTISPDLAALITTLVAIAAGYLKPAA